MTRFLAFLPKKKPASSPAGFVPGTWSHPRGRSTRARSRECSAGQVVPAHLRSVYGGQPHPRTAWAKPRRLGRTPWGGWFALILAGNKTRQGYARKRILKPAGYFFVGVPWSC